ncbi:response regulator [Candidatus Uhrbacteria bacterium]|nr:response regulator [Candidatus Uhrbacteria bacterium]
MDKQKILIIEDDGFLASIYAQKLEVEGFQPTLATNGEDGIRLAQKDRPALILLDLMLPKMNGFEALEALKREPATADIPILVLTNLGQRQDVERCLALGAAGYIIKAHALPHETIAKIKAILQ